MKIACVDALAGLARVPPPESVAAAYGVDELRFGPDYLIPKPFDTRLIVELPAAVAKAAMDTGVASRPLPDLAAYRQRLGAAGDQVRPDDEADLRGRARQSAAAGLRRRRGGARAARGAGRGRRGSGEADPDWPAGGDRRPGRAPGPGLARGPALRADQPGQRPALQRLCRLLPRPGRPQGRLAADRARHAAHPAHGDRGRDAGAAARPTRCWPARSASSRPTCARSPTCSGCGRRCRRRRPCTRWCWTPAPCSSPTPASATTRAPP